MGEGVKIAVLGCGRWGQNLVRNFHQLGALVAISDVEPTRAAVFAKQFDVPALDVEAILADSGIDAVVVAAPAPLHAELAIRAFNAGKHVFVEKPLALTVADGERVIRAAEATDRRLMVGHLLRYHPAFLALREMIDEGRLGPLCYIYSNRLNLGILRSEENVFWSFAPHDVSMILALAGAEPSWVRAEGGAFLQNGIEDFYSLQLKFASGAHGHVQVSWLHPFKEQKLVVVGETAMAVFDDRAPWPEKLMLYPYEISGLDKGMLRIAGGAASSVPVAEAEPLKLECAHFLHCVLSGERPRTDGLEGLSVLKVLRAGDHSIERGDWVSINDRGTSAKAMVEVDRFVHETAVVDDGASIGQGTRIWHFSHVLNGVRIGSNVTVGQNVMIGPDVTVGDDCKIQNNVSLYKGVELGEGVFCGPSCVFTNVNTPRAQIERKDEFRYTPVRKGASIGANATIICGHELGEYCFVGAGAVVTKDVPAHALVLGNPARQVGWVSHDGERLGDDLVCPRSKRRYAEWDGILVELA